MQTETAINMAVGVVMASLLDLKTKTELINALRQIERDLKHGAKCKHCGAELLGRCKACG